MYQLLNQKSFQSHAFDQIYTELSVALTVREGSMITVLYLSVRRFLAGVSSLNG